ncbi:hypothetical protein EON67_09150 [archaeon]|nr:MAG: hypothetical protein EON67_09150 [archaeon]
MSGSDDEGMGSDDGGEEYHYSDVSEDDEETCTPSLPRASSGLSRQVSSQSDTEGGGSAVARLTSAARENGLAGGVGDVGVNKGMVRTAAWVSTNLSDYKIINKSELGDEHRRRVRALASLFSIPMPVANVLLIYYKCVNAVCALRPCPPLWLEHGAPSAV